MLLKLRWLLLIGLILLTVLLNIDFAFSQEDFEFSSGKANFELKFKNEISPYRIMGVFVLPEEILSLDIHSKEKKCVYSIETGEGSLIDSTIGKWKWKVPKETGLYRIIIRNLSLPDSMILNIFVMVPFSELQGEYLNGYHIGKYPDIPFKGLSIYNKPRGFIEITPENEDTFISPHFTIKSFLSKQENDYPKYLVLRERLILKLELILERVNENGYKCGTLHIMSGYRTPFYNELIGNVIYSRHVWGGAADVFIDENPVDENMDDLNGDNIINYKDAAILYTIIDTMYGKPFYEPFWGGLGRYRKTDSHGPFVHVDVRGFRARWGD